MECVEYLNNFSTNKIIWDNVPTNEYIKSKDITDTTYYTLDTENTNDNDVNCITYATQLMEFGTKSKNSKDIKYIPNELLTMNLFTHPSLFWEHMHNIAPQNIECYVFNAEYDVNNLLNYAIKKYGLVEQSYKIEAVEEYEGLYKDSTKRLSKSDIYTYKKMNRNGKIYRCEVNLNSCTVGKTKGIKKITIIDMAKKLVGTLKSNVEAFTQLKMNKSDLDYSKFRDFYYRDYEENELLYMWNDVYCLAELTKEYVFSGKYAHSDKLTTSSMALANYKDCLYEDFMESITVKSHALHEIAISYMKYCKDTKISFIVANKDIPKYNKLFEKYHDYKNAYEDGEQRFIIEEYMNQNDIFNYVYPKLSFKSFDYIRPSYCGGITRYKDKKDVGKWIKGNGMGIDINSSFPYSYTKFKLPYGEGRLITDNDIIVPSDDVVQVVRCRVMNFKIKKNKEPNISKVMLETMINKKNLDTWIKEFNGEGVLTLTSCDYEYFINNYNFEYIEILDYMEYKAIVGLFNKFTNKFYGIKSTKGIPKGVIKWAKLILNGAYGKFGQNKCSDLREDKYNSETNSLEDNIVRIEENTVEILSEGVYIPIATFVTAYSRLHLIEVMNIINSTKGIKWKYCDTDSSYVIGDTDILKKALVKYIDIDYSGELGKWKIEKYFSKILIIGIKKYIYYGAELLTDTYTYHATLSGINGKYFKYIEEFCNKDDKCISNISKDDREYIMKVQNGELNYYVGEDDNPFIYKDKKLTNRIVGAYRSIRKKTVNNGQILFNTIYCIKGEIK